MPFYTKQIKERFHSGEWYGPYNLIEFILNNTPENRDKEILRSKINKVFKDERAPYIVVNNQIVPQLTKEEVKEIESAASPENKCSSARQHIQNAITLFSRKPEGDYKNSIKESICAIEALSKDITGEEKGTLGQIVDSLNIHPALKESIKKLYGWTSDEGGVRHSEKETPFEIGLEEARYMLVICSALINYIISKQDAK